jgi:hypothetical protein
MLTDAAGVPFYIGDTMPLTLLEKRIITASAGIIDLFTGDGSPRYVFVNSNAPQGGSLPTCEALEISGNVWRLRVAGPTRQINVFIFGYQFQPIPAWGIQINDAQGRCILTNETKVLCDVQNLGDSAADASSGYQFQTTLSGVWAVAPVYTGYFSGVINQNGQPMPVNAQFASSARSNGSTTQIASGYIGNVESGVSSATYSNYRNRITAINVSRY